MEIPVRVTGEEKRSGEGKGVHKKQYREENGNVEEGEKKGEETRRGGTSPVGGVEVRCFWAINPNDHLLPLAAKAVLPRSANCRILYYIQVLHCLRSFPIDPVFGTNVYVYSFSTSLFFAIWLHDLCLQVLPRRYR